MKKFVFIFFIGAVLLIALFGYVALSKPQQQSQQDVNCSSLASSDVASERSFGLLISNRQLLTIKQDNEKNFAPPGGHVESFESAKTALLRELNEEVNLTVTDDNLDEYNIFCKREQENIIRIYYYLIDAPEDQAFNIVSDGDSLKWVGYSFINDDKSDQELRDALNYLKSDQLID